MQLVYGTKNAAKLESMRRMLAGLAVEVVGLDACAGPLPAVDETGRDPLENATQKALAYYAALGRPVFSCDSGLFIDGLPDEEQPGVHVRTVAGHRLTDEEMIAHYAGIARRLGGRCTARYRNAVCLVLSGDTVLRHMGPELSGVPFLLVPRPHPRPVRQPGFPLDSLSVEIASGEYYYDLAARRLVDDCGPGFRQFFRGALAGSGPGGTQTLQQAEVKQG